MEIKLLNYMQASYIKEMRSTCRTYPDRKLDMVNSFETPVSDAINQNNQNNKLYYSFDDFLAIITLLVKKLIQIERHQKVHTKWLDWNNYTTSRLVQGLKLLPELVVGAVNNQVKFDMESSIVQKSSK